MQAIYNEIDSFACEWLQELIEAGHIMNGVVDQRRIEDVESFANATRVHLFAGIAGWDLALQYARWPADREVWTGSCPCQPFSVAGKGGGEDDKRHLWPEMRRLIEKHRPATVFGEQVASKLGRAWLARVQADLEALGYRFAAADLCGACIGAPHIRQRLFWVADLYSSEFSGVAHSRDKSVHADRRRVVGGLPDAEINRQHGRLGSAGKTESGEEVRSGSSMGGVDDSLSKRRGKRGNDYTANERFVAKSDVNTSGMVNSSKPRSQRHLRDEANKRQSRWDDSKTARSIATPGAWSASVPIACKDGKRRRVPEAESGVLPLAYGIPRGVGQLLTEDQRVASRPASSNRVGRLRGYGNAIIPPLAAIFIKSFMESNN